MPTPVIRDDNLRLIFSPVQSRLLEEKLLAIRAGMLLLAIFIGATVAITFSLTALDPARAYLGGIFELPLLYLWMMAIGTTLLSPVIAAMLIIEYRGTLRERLEHWEFLESYGRLDDKHAGETSAARRKFQRERSRPVTVDFAVGADSDLGDTDRHLDAP